jgi:DNA-binding transcriptional LysR family regulator
MSKLPDLEAWAIFARVAELRSFSAAAEALGLSKATVSKAVGRLENRLGVSLFHRTTRTLSLTPSGVSLASRAAALLSDAEAAEESARAEAGGPRGLVRIAVPMSFGISHVAPALPELMELCPGLSLDLHLSDTTIDLIEGGIDVALRIGALTDSSLKARKLADIPVYLAAAPAYIERHGTPGTPEDLESHACFGYSNASRADRWRLVHEDGKEAVVRPRGPLVTNNGEAMLPPLVAGQGIALLPHFILARDFEAGRLARVLPEWAGLPIALHVVTPSSGPRPARVSAVIDFFSRRFARLT